MKDPRKLRELAAWYRLFAEKTENDWIWAARLRVAGDLERQAVRLDAAPATVAAVRPVAG